MIDQTKHSATDETMQGSDRFHPFMSEDEACQGGQSRMRRQWAWPTMVALCITVMGWHREVIAGLPSVQSSSKQAGSKQASSSTSAKQQTSAQKAPVSNNKPATKNRTQNPTGAVRSSSQRSSSSSSSSSVQDEDGRPLLSRSNREPVDPNLPGNEYLKPIGEVYYRAEKMDPNSKYVQESESTGFLLDECHVLTVKHAVGSAEKYIETEEVANDGLKKVNGTKVVFKIGFDIGDTTKFKDSANGIVIGSGGDHDYGDWAVIRIDKNLGTEDRYDSVSLWPTGSQNMLCMETAGFPADKAITTNGKAYSKQMWRNSGKYAGEYNRVFYNTPVVSKQSGSPAFGCGNIKGVFGLVVSGEGKHQYVTVGTGKANVYEKTSVIPILKIRSDIREVVDRDPCQVVK